MCFSRRPCEDEGVVGWEVHSDLLHWREVVCGARAEEERQVIEMAGRGNAGRGSRGACGGRRRRDGSGGGVGNRGTARQPKKGR